MWLVVCGRLVFYGGRWCLVSFRTGGWGGGLLICLGTRLVRKSNYTANEHL